MAERKGSSGDLPTGEELENALNDIFRGRGRFLPQKPQLELDLQKAESRRASLQFPYMPELFDALFPPELPIGELRQEANKVFFYFPGAVRSLSDKKMNEGDMEGAQILSQFTITGACSYALRQEEVTGRAFGGTVPNSDEAEEAESEARRWSRISQIMNEAMVLQTKGFFFD